MAGMKTITQLSPEEHEARKAADRAKYQANRVKRAEKAKARYHAMSPEERERRTAYNQAKYATQDKAARRQQDRARRATETPQQRQVRLDKILVDSRRKGGVLNPTAERKTGMCSTRGCEYVGQLHFDHWHAGPRQGEFRGWVCSNCNTAMGLAADSPDKLRALAEYIELQAGIGWPLDTDQPAG